MLSRGESVRGDDNLEAFERRLRAYAAQTKPLTRYYDDLGILRRVDGMRSIEQVAADIDDIMEGLVHGRTTKKGKPVMAESTGNQPSVTPQMRETGEQSVAQARKAYEQYATTTDRVLRTMENSARQAWSGAREVNIRMMAFADENAKAGFDYAERFVKAKDAEEVLSLQQAYLKAQSDRLSEQMRELQECQPARRARQSRQESRNHKICISAVHADVWRCRDRASPLNSVSKRGQRRGSSRYAAGRVSGGKLSAFTSMKNSTNRRT